MPVKYFPPFVSNALWGEINGDINDQSDLQNLLSGKSDNSHNHNEDYLAKDNTDAFMPTGDYHPATKKYADDNFEPADSTILKEADVIDDLFSTDTELPLSANQGKQIDLEQQRMKGIYLDLPYLYNHNTKLIDDCETIGNWTQIEGTLSADGTNKKTGSYGVKIEESDNTSSYLIADLNSISLDLTKFEDGSASTTSDFITMAVYVSDISALYDGNCIWIKISVNAEFDNTDFYQFILTRSSLSTGWNYISVQKSSFAVVDGSPSWSGVQSIRVQWRSNDSNMGEYITIDALQMVRNDPSDNKPNPFQEEIDGTNTRIFEVSSGTPFLGYDGSTLCVKGLENTDLVSALEFGSKLYIQSDVIATNSSSISAGKYQDDDNKLAAFFGDSLIARIEYSGTVDDESVSFPVNEGDEAAANVNINGRSINVNVSKTGSQASVSNYNAGAVTSGYCQLYLYENASITSFKASSSRLMAG